MADTRFIPTQRSGRASMLGASFGSGVGQGLEAIVSQMAQNKAEKIRAGHLKSLMPGASEEQISALSHLGSSVYEPALRGGFGQQEQIEKINPANPVSGSRGSGDFQAGPFFEMLSGMGLKMSPEQQKQLGSLPPERQEQIARQVFEKLSPQQQDRLEDAIKQRTALSQEQMPQKEMQQQPQQVIGSKEPGIAPVQQQKQPISLSQALQGGNKGNERLQFDKEKEKAVQDRYAHKANAKFVHDTLGLQKAKHEEDNILKRIIKVSEKEGSDVRNPVLTGIMRDIGIDYQGLKSGDTLEIDKLGRWFLRGGSKMFGGRVSNAEMYAILDQVPTALQTKEGRVRLAKQMLLANKDYHDEVKVMKSVIKENKGKYPLDLELQVDERMEPIRERNAYNFINGIYNGASSEKISHSFKVGQKISASQISSLPDGTKYKKGGKRFEFKDGKEVAL